MSSNSNSIVGATTVAKFRGSTSHDFMIWLAEWKNFLVYQGVHHIILNGTEGTVKDIEIREEIEKHTQGTPVGTFLISAKMFLIPWWSRRYQEQFLTYS